MDSGALPVLTAALTLLKWYSLADNCVVTPFPLSFSMFEFSTVCGTQVRGGRFRRGTGYAAHRPLFVHQSHIIGRYCKPCHRKGLRQYAGGRGRGIELELIYIYTWRRCDCARWPNSFGGRGEKRAQSNALSLQSLLAPGGYCWAHSGPRDVAKRARTVRR